VRFYLVLRLSRNRASFLTISLISSTSSKKSEAWIAGPVVGSIALVIIAALAFWTWKLKKGQHQSSTLFSNNNQANQATENPRDVSTA
jgi:hypothetical protein